MYSGYQREEKLHARAMHRVYCIVKNTPRRVKQLFALHNVSLSFSSSSFLFFSFLHHAAFFNINTVREKALYTFEINPSKPVVALQPMRAQPTF